MAACGVWGGVSKLWRWKSGKLPPFEKCCVDHDRHYVMQDASRADTDKWFLVCMVQRGHLLLGLAFYALIRAGGWYWWDGHHDNS